MESSENEEKNETFNPNDYVEMLQIGQGNFSELLLVEHINTKFLYAMKVFTKMRIEQLRKQADVLMEKHVMNKISRHQNIIKCYGFKKNDIFLYILYEYVNGGELWRKSCVYGLNCEKIIKYYFKQLLDAINHLHSYNIIHRDIKPENIMITKDELTLKVIDFGSCKDLEGTEFEKKIEEEKNKFKTRRREYKDFVGTPNYMSPECVRNKGSDKNSDIWSLGCVLYQLFSGFPPFLGKSDYLVFLKSTEASYKFPTGIFSFEAEDLIKKMIVIDPTKRISMEEIYKHKFMENVPERFPFSDLKDFAYKKIVNLLRQKYEKYKEITDKIKKINELERMNEDHRKTFGDEIKEGEVQYKIDEKEKEDLIDSHNKGLIDLEKSIKEITDELKILDNERIIEKFKFLQIQLKHEIFGIDYEGLVPNNHID